MATKEVKPQPMTEYERASLRLQAWIALDGWGRVKPNGGVDDFGWDERCRNAAELAGWAVSP